LQGRIAMTVAESMFALHLGMYRAFTQRVGKI